MSGGCGGSAGCCLLAPWRRRKEETQTELNIGRGAGLWGRGLEGGASGETDGIGWEKQ